MLFEKSEELKYVVRVEDAADEFGFEKEGGEEVTPPPPLPPSSLPKPLPLNWCRRQHVQKCTLKRRHSATRNTTIVGRSSHGRLVFYFGVFEAQRSHKYTFGVLWAILCERRILVRRAA